VPYPVTFEMDYVERRSRLTTLFRLILAIPHLIVLYLWGLVAGVAVILAWFALVVVARYPFWAYEFVAAYLRYATYVNGYLYLGTDRYPPFSGNPGEDYPVRLNIGEAPQSYSRAKAFFRLILAIPVVIVFYAMQIVAELGALFAWFVIIVLGRQPRGLQDMIALGLSYQQRATTYFALVTEDWPPFVDDHQQQQVEAAPAFGAIPAAPPAAGAATTADAPERPADEAPEPDPAPPPAAPEQEAAEPPPVADENDDEERPPGPFGPSSTQ